MKRVVIESPYNPSKVRLEARAWQMVDELGADYDKQNEQAREYWLMLARVQLIKENVQYARLLYKKALAEGHAPFASHLNYTQVWSEEPGFRERGISAGFAWGEVADLFWYGVDLGWSPGMLASLEKHGDRSVRIPLFPDWTEAQVRAHLATSPFEAFVGVE